MSTSDHDELMKKIHDEWPKPSPGILLSDSQAARVVAAARREGWAQAIEALRAEDAAIRAELTDSKGRFDWESYDPAYDLAADYLTDRATALTEEGQ